MTAGNESPTLPPPPDHMAAVVSRIEKKLDELTRVAHACFNAVQTVPLLEARVDTLEAKLENLERVVRDTEKVPPLNGADAE